MSILRSSTDPRWVEVAIAGLDQTLGDHAHCEKKAAASALKLVADHATLPDLVRHMAKLAQEELRHFLAVVAELSRRGLTLPPDSGDPYAQALQRLIRSGKGRLLDQLLVGGLIEARSCERLALLGEALERGGLRELYQKLARAEAGHAELFLDLARRHCGEGETAARLGVLAEEEARIVAGLPVVARIH